MRVIDRLHRTQTELHSKLIILAERRSEIAKATELKKQEESKSKQEEDTEVNSPQEDGPEDKDEVSFFPKKLLLEFNHWWVDCTNVVDEDEIILT